MKKCTCYPESITVVDFFESLGVPSGIVPGDRVILTISPAEWERPHGTEKKHHGRFLAVTKNAKGENVFIIEPAPGVMCYGDKLQPENPKINIERITSEMALWFKGKYPDLNFDEIINLLDETIKFKRTERDAKQS